MHLPALPRLTLAALLACAAFLALYLGAALTAWLALALAVAAYGAALLLIRETPPAAQQMVAPQVSLGDLRAAETALRSAAQEIGRLSPTLPQTIRPDLSQLSADLQSIATQVAADPEDYRKTRRFVSHFLPHMMKNIRAYADLAAKTGHSARLDQIGDGLRAYGPAVHRIEQACLENDFRALETEIRALDHQISRVRM